MASVMRPPPRSRITWTSVPNAASTRTNPRTVCSVSHKPPYRIAQLTLVTTLPKYSGGFAPDDRWGP